MRINLIIHNPDKENALRRSDVLPGPYRLIQNLNPNPFILNIIVVKG